MSIFSDSESPANYRGVHNSRTHPPRQVEKDHLREELDEIVVFRGANTSKKVHIPTEEQPGTTLCNEHGTVSSTDGTFRDLAANPPPWTDWCLVCIAEWRELLIAGDPR